MTYSRTYPVIEGAYLRDLLEQADALRRTLAAPLPEGLESISARLADSDPPFVVLTGMGSSFHALHPMATQLADHGIRATMIETSELIYFSHGLLGPGTVLVVVSQSGRSAEILRLLDLNAGRSTVIGVTNDVSSPLALAANAVVMIRAGAESSVSCKTYVSSLVALSRLSNALCSEGGTSSFAAAGMLADFVEQYMSNLPQYVEQAIECLHDAKHIVVVGRGGSLATAGTGGLIIKEAARFPAEGMSAAAFRHGPLEMVNRNLFLLVFEGPERSAELNQRLVSDVVELGGTAHLVSPASSLEVFRIPTLGETLRPVLEILPVQIITLALAAREGFEAGAFIRATKITSVE